jgi:hypothetical protein
MLVDAGRRESRRIVTTRVRFGPAFTNAIDCGALRQPNRFALLRHHLADKALIRGPLAAFSLSRAFPGRRAVGKASRADVASPWAWKRKSLPEGEAFDRRVE